MLLNAIRTAKQPVALTGAGISAPSGVPTFTSLWKGQPVRDFLSRTYRERDPVGFLELYCHMEAWCDAEPNAAHRTLACHAVPIITQNVDGLHQKAGAKRVIELHGSLRTVRCAACGRHSPARDMCRMLRPLLSSGDSEAVLSAFRCGCGGELDTDVVLYGDAVRGLSEATELLSGCDLLLVIGTSLETYPAAALPDLARRHGARVLIENTDCVAALSEKENE